MTNIYRERDYLRRPRVAEAVRWIGQDANTFEAPDEYAERREMQRQVRVALRDLSERERYTVVASHGIDGKGERVFRQIGEELDPPVSLERARQLYVAGLRKLKWSRHHLFQHVDPPGVKRERMTEVWARLREDAERGRHYYEQWKQRVQSPPVVVQPPPPPPPEPEKPPWQVRREEYLARYREAKLELEALEERARLFHRSAAEQWRLEQQAGIHSMTHWKGEIHDV